MAKIEKSERLIGTVVPVAALRGNSSVGVGEFPDLVPFGGLCKKMGIGLIQILPVNDTGYQDSPYFALTAFALHPLYLCINELPEARDFEPEIREIGLRFEKEKRFPYLELLRAKMALLRRIYEKSAKTITQSADGKTGLAAWISANPWVREYAVFRRLKEQNGEKSWKEWKDNRVMSAPEIEALWNNPAFRQDHIFWAWIQEALDRQFSAAAKSLADMGLLLEGDLPILINEDSCDVWAHPAIFNSGLSAGAPPDMYSPDGQNWGFPTFNWQVQEKDGYAWWKARLKTAEKYYSAYRIDHVLGFFRIWSSRREDVTSSSALGRYVPSVPVTAGDLAELGFDANRIRWMSLPHIPTGEVWNALKAGWDRGQQELEAAAGDVFAKALTRINNEELWLFKNEIRGSRDIEAMALHPAAKAFLINAWNNRLFLEYENGLFAATWFYRETRAYASLSDSEKVTLEALLKKRNRESEAIWEREGKKLLTVLASSSSMLPCAEDLGAVPDCVPKVLGELGILGLRVVRWFRDWEKDGQPYIPFEKYPELSVCTPAVHDSSTLREWWDREAEQELFSGFLGFPGLPKVYNPGAAKNILFKIAGAASRYRVFQIQEILHLSHKWYAADPAEERINVPGTSNTFNWTWRLPATPAEIAKDDDLINTVKELAAVKPVGAKAAGAKPADTATAKPAEEKPASAKPARAKAEKPAGEKTGKGAAKKPVAKKGKTRLE